MGRFDEKELRIQARDHFKARRDLVRAAQEVKKGQCLPIVSLKFESVEPQRRTVFDGIKNRELPLIEISSGEEPSVIFTKNIKGHWV